MAVASLTIQKDYFIASTPKRATQFAFLLIWKASELTNPLNQTSLRFDLKNRLTLLFTMSVGPSDCRFVRISLFGVFKARMSADLHYRPCPTAYRRDPAKQHVTVFIALSLQAPCFIF